MNLIPKVAKKRIIIAHFVRKLLWADHAASVMLAMNVVNARFAKGVRNQLRKSATTANDAIHVVVARNARHALESPLIFASIVNNVKNAVNAIFANRAPDPNLLNKCAAAATGAMTAVPARRARFANKRCLRTAAIASDVMDAASAQCANSVRSRPMKSAALVASATNAAVAQHARNVTAR